jgi:hypothetical protein
MRRCHNYRPAGISRAGSLTVTAGVRLQAPCFLVASAVLTVTFTSKASQVFLLDAAIVRQILAEFAAFLRHLGAGADYNGRFNCLAVLERVCTVKASVSKKEFNDGGVGLMRVGPGVMEQSFSIDPSAQV